MLQQGIGHRFDRPPVPLQQTVGALPLAGERAITASSSMATHHDHGLHRQRRLVVDL